MTIRFQIVGQTLPPPKLNLDIENDYVSARVVSRHAARCIEHLDKVLGDRCLYCQSGLYDAIPLGGCPACHLETRDERPVGESLQYRGGGRILSVR